MAKATNLTLSSPRVKSAITLLARTLRGALAIILPGLLLLAVPAAQAAPFAYNSNAGANTVSVPLYWFGPLPPLPLTKQRQFIGSDDFNALFEAASPWQKASDHIQVFRLFGEWVGNHLGDAELARAVSDLRRRKIALAVELGLKQAKNAAMCDRGIQL